MYYSHLTMQNPVYNPKGKYRVTQRLGLFQAAREGGRQLDYGQRLKGRCLPMEWAPRCPSAGEWLSACWVLPDSGTSFMTQSSELSTPGKMWTNLKCPLLGEEIQSEKVTYV